MKYFLKLRILKDNKEQATHYFVPDYVSAGVEVEEGYVINSNTEGEKYSFSILKDRKFIGGFSNSIKPKQVIEIVDDDNVLTFSLTSNKRTVKKYLKNKPGTTVREMEEFYLYIGKKIKTKKRRSRGPLHPTSGMDPDLRAEYAKGEKDN